MFKRKNNSIPGKDKLYKLIEKYRKPNQTYIAKAMAVVLPDTEKTGMIGLEIASFDGTNWLMIVRLKDVYELHQENKIEVINLNVDKMCVKINDTDMEFIFIKQDIKNPNLVDISANYEQAAMNYLYNNRGF